MTMNTKLNAIFTLSVLMSFFSGLIASNVPINQDVLAQGLNTHNTGPLNVNVQVSNTGNAELIGSIHVISDITGVSKNANGIIFASGQAVIQPFDFNQTDIPNGADFNVELVYGDDFSKIAHGVNNQTDMPVFFNIKIP
jgi:hypothetical protein